MTNAAYFVAIAEIYRTFEIFLALLNLSISYFLADSADFAAGYPISALTKMKKRMIVSIDQLLLLWMVQHWQRMVGQQQ